MCKSSLWSEMTSVFLALTWFAVTVISHECIHHKIAKQLTPLRQLREPLMTDKTSPLLSDRERMLEAASNSEYRQMKMVFDFSNIQSIDTDTRSFIENVLLIQMQRRIQTIIKVNGPTTIPAFSETGCDQMIKVPSSYANTVTKADLLIIVGAAEDKDTYVAYASPCLLNSFNSRPSVGMIMINLSKLQIYRDSVDKFVSVLLHELFHILVLSPTLFDHFPITKSKAVSSEMRSTKIGSSQISKIISPGLVAAGKKHLGCTSFDGIFLENEGGSASAGSHFEKAITGNDLMTAEENGRMVLSFWTLNLLNDCGWYSVDLLKAENLDWGKNQGCGFINANCNTKYPSFCSTEGKMACSEDYFSKQVCISQSFSDGCLIYENPASSDCSSAYGIKQTSLYEGFGPKSRCFATNIDGQSTVGCYSSSCDVNSIKIKIANTTLSCTKAGESIQYEDLTIVCPDVKDFCSRMNQTCTNDCSGRGKCLQSKDCFCDYFSEGADCSTLNACGLAQTTCAKMERLSDVVKTTSSSGSLSFAAAVVAIQFVLIALLFK